MQPGLVPILLGKPFPIRSGLVAFYDFHEGSGQAVADRVGGYDATLGSTAGVDANDPTWVGKTLDFVTDDYIENTALPDSAVTGAITLMIVARVDTGSAFRHFMGKHTAAGATNNPFDFRTTNDVAPQLFLVRANATDVSTWTAASTAALGAWRCYTVTSTILEATAAFYVGTTAETVARAGTQTGAATGNNASLRIGLRADAAIALDGAVAFAAVYNRALNAGEIAQNYSVFMRLAAPRGISLP